MGEEKERNLGGRPPTKIDWQEFDKLCEIQCTLREIAGWFDCSEDAIERAVKRVHKCGFAEYFSKKKARGRVSLRRMQLYTAENNPTMQIWLGKQWLDQSDKKELVADITTTRLGGLTDEEIAQLAIDAAKILSGK